MRARPIILILSSIIALFGCTSDQGVRLDGPPLTLSEDAIPQPYWVSKPPAASGYHFFLGESHGSDTREDGLEKAWISAFVRIGMTEFPELSKITSRSVENLRGASFERRFSLRLERVDWSGVKEAKQFGSPYVEYDRVHKKFSVYRLVKWSASDMASAKKQVSRARQFQLPASPEARRFSEDRIVNAVRGLNQKVGQRNVLLAKVFDEVKCGVTLDDLIAILGPPDRTSPYNSARAEKEYFWGEFRVARAAGDPAIAAVTREDETQDRKVICPNRLRND